MKSHCRAIRSLCDLKKGPLLEVWLARVRQDLRATALTAPTSVGKQTQIRAEGTRFCLVLGRNNHDLRSLGSLTHP